MDMKVFESVILNEVKQVTHRNKLRMKDIVKWTVGECRVSDPSREKVYYLPGILIKVVVKDEIIRDQTKP